MIMMVIVCTGKTFLCFIFKSAPYSCVVLILMRALRVLSLLLKLIPSTHYTFLLNFRQNFIWSLSNYIWRWLFFSFRYFYFCNRIFLWYRYLGFGWILLAFSWTLWIFSTNSFRSFFLTNKACNVVLRNLKLKNFKLWSICDSIVQRWVWLYQIFSVYFAFHLFKIL
jgi:hypothetical protein